VSELKSKSLTSRSAFNTPLLTRWYFKGPLLFLRAANSIDDAKLGIRGEPVGGVRNQNCREAAGSRIARSLTKVSSVRSSTPPGVLVSDEA
jgi:hypothetical protein